MALFSRTYGKHNASTAVEKMTEVDKMYQRAALGGIGSVSDPAFIDHFTRAMNQISRTSRNQQHHGGSERERPIHPHAVAHGDDRYAPSTAGRP